MREYETIFIVQPELSDEGRQAIVQRLDALLEREKAVRLELNDWGKRRLALEIRKFQKGHYLSLSYGSDGSLVPELERVLRLDESVLRFLTVVVSEQIEDIAKRRQQAEEHERVQRERAAERAREAEETQAEGGDGAESDRDRDDADERSGAGRGERGPRRSREEEEE